MLRPVSWEEVDKTTKRWFPQKENSFPLATLSGVKKSVLRQKVAITTVSSEAEHQLSKLSSCTRDCQGSAVQVSTRQSLKAPYELGKGELPRGLLGGECI